MISVYKQKKDNNVTSRDYDAMKRYIDDQFIPSLRDSNIEQEDVRAFKYKDILTQNLWRKNMELIKK